MSRFPLLLGLCALATTPTWATTFAFDDFSSGNLTNEAGDPLDLAWYGYNSGNSVSVSTGALENAPGSNSFRGALGYLPAPIDLATFGIGDGIRLTFDVRGLNVVASNTTAFRFGLHNANGALGTSSGDGAFENDRGYFARVAWRESAILGSNAADVLKETGAQFPLGGTDATVLTGGSGTGGALFGGTTMQTFGLEIVRASASSVTLTVLQGASLTPIYTVTDSTSPFLVFDQVTIGTGGITNPLRIDNVMVTQVIPEPGTWSLALGAIGLGLTVYRWRRRSSWHR